MKDYLYFDYAAATPVDERVLAAMQPYFSAAFYNPSALYAPALAVAKDVAAARASIAAVLGARPAEITFTAGGTEANNLAIQGVMAKFPGKHMVTTAIEHDSVLYPARKYDFTEVKPKPDGRIAIDGVANAIRDDTVLVSVQYANNEIGTVQPIRDIAALIDDIKQQRRKNSNDTPLYFHSDACQASLYLDLHVARLGVDLLTLNGGKMYGPKQSGLLYIKGGLVLMPLLLGGGQEAGVRSGTENVPFIIGLAKALELAQQNRKAESERLHALKDKFIKGLAEQLSRVEVTGTQKFRLPNNVHITIPGGDNERLLFQLDEAGIMAAAGSACSASRNEPSHVLRALGMSDEQARSSLRFSFGRATDEAAVDTLLRTLLKIVR
ncbi:MAG TPA: cysteine desulfurase family protein [Candidatus Saccharimonadales bacterium]|nr:cysteine desulfurase family protein [Candidatus Saccharimonadales bacterium]